jgi:HemY protein
MIRKALLILALIAAVLLGAYAMQGYAGRVQVEWLGYRLETNVLFALLAALALYTLLWTAARLLASLIFVGRHVERYKRRRLIDGLDALSAALLAGDVADTERRLRQLPESFKRRRHGLVQAVRAGLAAEKGDAAEAERIASGLASLSEYRLAALRTRTAAARMTGDDASALLHAEEAVSCSRHAAWADRTVKDIAMKEKKWGKAREALKRLSSYALSPVERREYANVSLLRARELLRMDQKSQGLKAAHAAYRLLPDDDAVAFSYAAILAETQEIGALEELVLERRKDKPSLAFGRLFLRAIEPCSERDKMKKIARLQEAAPEAPETWILKAELCLGLGRVATAKEALEQSLSLRPSREAYELTAQIEEKHGAGDRFAIENLRERAERAPALLRSFGGECGEGEEAGSAAGISA